MSLPQNVINITTVLPHLFTVPTVLPWYFSHPRGNNRGHRGVTVIFPHPRGNNRGYRGVTAFPITVSSS